MDRNFLEEASLTQGTVKTLREKNPKEYQKSDCFIFFDDMVSQMLPQGKTKERLRKKNKVYYTYEP